MACTITAGTVAQDTIQWQHEQAKAQEFRVRTTLCRGTDLMSVQQHKTSNLGRRPSRFNPVLASTDAHFSPHDTRWRDEQSPPSPRGWRASTTENESGWSLCHKLAMDGECRRGKSPTQPVICYPKLATNVSVLGYGMNSENPRPFR